MPESKIVITGTGRAGTTLLVQILTDLGLDTGFSADAPIDERAHAGLERTIDAPTAPRIVKHLGVYKNLGPLIDEGKVAVEHVIVPVRDLDIATASRVRATRYGVDPAAWGGLAGTRRATSQKEALAMRFYLLFDVITRYDLPVTLLRFPRFAHDWEYTYEKLRFLDPSIPAERWQEVVGRRADPNLIHEEPLTRAERSFTRAGTFYTRVLRRGYVRARKTVEQLGTRRAGNHDDGSRT